MPISDDTKKQLEQAAEATKAAAHETLHEAKAFADDMHSSAQEAMKNSRAAAGKAFSKAQEGLKAAERELSPSIDDLAARAQDFASRSINFCADNSERARRQFQNAADVTTRYVVEQPGKSVLLAAAAGAAVAAAVLMGTRRR